MENKIQSKRGTITMTTVQKHIQFFRRLQSEEESVKGNTLQYMFYKMLDQKRQEYIHNNPDSIVEEFIVELYGYIKDIHPNYQIGIFKENAPLYSGFHNDCFFSQTFGEDEFGIRFIVVSEDLVALDMVKLVNAKEDKWDPYPSFEDPVKFTATLSSPMEHKKSVISRCLDHFYTTLYDIHVNERFR